MTDPLRWTGELIRSLYRNGVRHAIISPGSRSTPLTLAAAIHPGIQNKVVLDERSAAFIALGIAKSSGKPALLICTSGSALANYFPAVAEARFSGVPMIILSADRPPLLRGIGSSQTIDQLKIFGDYVSFFHDTGEPNLNEEDLKRMDYLGKQAVEKSILNSGPVHINLPFRKPLEPDRQTLQEESDKSNRQFTGTGLAHHKHHVSRVVTPGEPILELLERSVKPLILCGPTGTNDDLGEAVQTACSRLNAPLICEPGSATEPSGRFNIKRFGQFLQRDEYLNSLRPDCIVRFGNQPYTRAVLTALNHWKDIPVIHIHSNNSTQDHQLSVAFNVLLHPDDRLTLPKLKHPKSGDWLDRWKEYDAMFQETLTNALDHASHLTDAHVIDFFSKQLDEEWNVMISNSFTVRDVALFGSAAKHQFVNRGAAGIDGIHSTAIGVLSETGRPTCCLIGDLAFFHDSNALLSLSGAAKAPLLSVVINNGGGTIFRMLPIYRSESLNIPGELFETYFETPQSASIQKLAESAGIPYIRVESREDLRELDLTHMTRHTLIECVTDPVETMKLRENLWAG